MNSESIKSNAAVQQRHEGHPAPLRDLLKHLDKQFLGFSHCALLPFAMLF